MRELTFEPIAETHVPLVEAWLEDRESHRRVGGMIPFRPCFEYMHGNPDCHHEGRARADRRHQVQRQNGQEHAGGHDLAISGASTAFMPTT